MTKIFKYPLKIKDFQTLHLPFNAIVLSVEFQGNQLNLWAIINPNIGQETPRTFEIVGTGNEMKELFGERKFIQTVFDPRGFVWHVFELI